MELPEWPEWLDERLLDSGPGAYETLEPRLRAALKSQIALLHRYHGELEGWECQSRDWLGRELRAESTPKSWALFLLDKAYASPSGLLAALMPAILAGVEEVLVCLLADEDEKNFELSLPISAALELAGVEQVWSLNPAQLSRLFVHLRGMKDCSENAGQAVEPFRGQGDGAVVFLGDWTVNAGTDKFMLDVLRSGLACKCLPGVFETALRLQPGNEAFWIWPDLTPEFFRRHTAGIFNRENFS
ncbi:MAG: histidinol dehydrogenase [Deltaproteobacteria bacterium]|jgi:hypothetical protein|nr:histidinol dehydrogenase [Deltaproteobacteria bacterium]